MILTKLQGPVTHLQQSTETSGFVNQGQGQIRTAQVLGFRVNNRQVAHKMPSGGMGISNSDDVTLIGREKSGTVQVFCIRNDTTGAVMYGPYMLVYVIGGLVLLIATPLIFAGDGIVFGLPLAALGAYLIFAGRRVVNANRELTATRAIKSAPVAHTT